MFKCKTLCVHLTEDTTHPLDISHPTKKCTQATIHLTHMEACKLGLAEITYLTPPTHNLKATTCITAEKTHQALTLIQQELHILRIALHHEGCSSNTFLYMLTISKEAHHKTLSITLLQVSSLLLGHWLTSKRN
jgi:hypothetical protein